MSKEDCFGDPWVWSEGVDHSDALASNDWILIKAPALRALAAREVGEPHAQAMNRLVIPEMDADMESLRSDLRKLIKLHADMSQVVEALSAAVLQIRDKLELPAAPAPKPAPPAEPLNAIVSELQEVGQALWSTNALRGRQVNEIAQRLATLIGKEKSY